MQLDSNQPKTPLSSCAEDCSIITAHKTVDMNERSGVNPNTMRLFNSKPIHCVSRSSSMLWCYFLGASPSTAFCNFHFKGKKVFFWLGFFLYTVVQKFNQLQIETEKNEFTPENNIHFPIFLERSRVDPVADWAWLEKWNAHMKN